MMNGACSLPRLQQKKCPVSEVSLKKNKLVYDLPVNPEINELQKLCKKYINAWKHYDYCGSDK